MHRLITIRISHYNERARWGLDRFQVPYEEEAFMPLFHLGGVLWRTRGQGAGRADRVSSSFSTPVLLTDRGHCLRDSGDIVRYASLRWGTADTTLFPTPEVDELAQRFHDKLGPRTRSIVYHHTLPDRAVCAALADRNVGPTQARAFKLLQPIIGQVIRTRFGLTAERVLRWTTELYRELDRIAEIRGTKRYLLGDRFTAADLTFACMLAPVLLVRADEGYSASLPTLEEVPPELATVARHVRRHPAGAFALRLFREERGERQVPFLPGR